MRPPRETTAPAATRGRPSKTDAVLLRTRIQAAARAEFREHGYAGTSIDAIARAAAVSRTTIYALYTDKPTLFTEMIRATVHGPDLFDDLATDDRAPVVVLRDAMFALNRAYYRETNMAIVRLCIAEVDRFPDLTEDVRSRLSLSLRQLCAYFMRMQAHGQMLVDDCWKATLLFNMMALGSLKPFFKHQDRISDSEATDHIDLALRIFMRGCFIDGDAALPPPRA